MGMIRRNLKRRAAGNVAHVKDDFSQYMNEPEEPLPFSDVKIEETKPYTKTDINRMSKEDLASLANDVGIVGAEDKSGSDLKKELINKFGL